MNYLANITPIRPADIAHVERNGGAAPASIVDNIRDFMGRFIAWTDDDHGLVLALWILHTYTVESANFTPYIYITSAEKRSGKSRVIETARVLAHNPLVGTQVTSSSMFRVIEAQRPTLFIDEVDTVWSGGKGNEELRGLLNSGFRYDGSIPRTVSTTANEDDPSGGVKWFSTFCPKLMAGIDNAAVPDTILDRSIRIVLKRMKDGETRERFVTRRVEPQAKALKAIVEEWAINHMDALMDMEVDPIDAIGDRAWDIAEPLVMLARLAGCEDEARAALTNLLAEEEEALSVGAQVLTAARDIFEATGSDKMATATLIEATGHNGKRLGVILKPYGITPRTIRMGQNTIKGYHKADFQDAWERYL